MTLEHLRNESHDAAVQFLLAIADDDFFTGNRLGRWVGSGPTLEEDNALSSILQDEVGHARLWYEVIADEQGRSITELAHDRDVGERRNSILVEPDHEDFADTIVRSLLYDRAEKLLVQSIRDGENEELGGRAEVVLNEELFHREHADRWLEVLSTTDEASERLEAAFERNVPRSRDYFAFEDDLEESLLDAGIIARGFDELRADWVDDVTAIAASINMDVDVEELRATLESPPELNGRTGDHTDALPAIVDDLYPTEKELYPDDLDFDGDIRYREKIGLS